MELDWAKLKNVLTFFKDQDLSQQSMNIESLTYTFFANLNFLISHKRPLSAFLPAEMKPAYWQILVHINLSYETTTMFGHEIIHPWLFPNLNSDWAMTIPTSVLSSIAGCALVISDRAEWALVQWPLHIWPCGAENKGLESKWTEIMFPV